MTGSASSAPSKRWIVLASALALVAASLVFAVRPSPAGAAMSWQRMTPMQRAHASGALEIALAPNPGHCKNPTGGGDEGDEADNECPPTSYQLPSAGVGGTVAGYQPTGGQECSETRGTNVKVNQNCQNVSDPDLAGRGQAQNETSIAIDPMNPKHIVASQNDYRRGDGNCYGAYSLDAGRTWNDTTIPMSFTRGTNFGNEPRQYWQAGGDTSVAWDTKGNVYFSCQVFNRGSDVTANPDQSSAFYVFRSTGNDGASWSFPGSPVAEARDAAGAGVPFEDKQLITVDNHPGSPYQDRVYVSWTEYAADGSAYIYEAYSADYGRTFSPKHIVSKGSAYCTNTFGAGTPLGACNQNQFSQPFTGSDGALYVVYDNFNNQATSGTDNKYQVLLSKSVDGGRTFGAPRKVSDYYDLPDCDVYQHQDPGRACVPEKGPSTNSIFRATNYASGAVDPTNAKRVVISFGSYINRHSQESNGCQPNGYSALYVIPKYRGTKTPGACNNDILISSSTDGGTTFSGTNADPRVEPTVTDQPRQALTDQFWQWLAFTTHGTLVVSYYDRQYGALQPHDPVGTPANEYRGYSDISVSAGTGSGFAVSRVTSGSMPPPTQFGGLFYGDYSGLDARDTAYPIWMDTRDPEVFACPTSAASQPPTVCTGTYSTPTGPVLANDQNIYTAAVSIPGS